MRDKRTRIIHMGRVFWVKEKITERCGINSRLSQGDGTICKEA
jgi:hypothetical protein